MVFHLVRCLFCGCNPKNGLNSRSICEETPVMAQYNSLSVLVPVYNWDCSELLNALHGQGVLMGVPFEILVADDCSTDLELSDRVRNTARGLEHCRYIGLTGNLGRAAVRNMLAAESKYRKLLFLDCDSRVVTDGFLGDYLSASESSDVVCGRLVHPDTLPKAGVELRYRYEKRADRYRWAEIRQKNPYNRFTPFSFLIDREVFDKIRFDVSYSGYGYEDVAFGMELKKRGVPVLHIDTPLMHMGLEDNAMFLEKSRAAVRNAYSHRDTLGNGSAVLNGLSLVNKLHIGSVGVWLWNSFHEGMEKNLTGANPSLWLFSLYKLCYICSLKED